MRMRSNQRRWVLLGLLHLWWLSLSGRYLWGFWSSAAISGVDASGHVAALHLYAAHVYPDVQGWLPEFFGGMPFPVFYPPLFYWSGATLMKVGGVNATLAAKIITISSFAALPGVLFGLGRRLGMTSVESAVSAALAGIIACGLNFVALFAVGLVGLFEIGLYTHTLGFLWFCLWCGALPHLAQSHKARLVAVASLSAMILTNIHVLPLSAAYGLCWFIFDGWRTWQSTSQHRNRKLLVKSVTSISLVTASISITGVWLIPFLQWNGYVLGQSQSSEGLFATIGLLNILWLPCALVAAMEYRRRPALAGLCVALLVAAIVSMLPLDKILTVPFQPWRLISAAMLLATLPTALLSIKLLQELLKHKTYVLLCSAFVLLFLEWLHPNVLLKAASLSDQETADFQTIRNKLKALGPGMVVVEILDADESSDFAVATASVRKQTASRALIHQLAMDGRPVIWSVFREHAVSAPFATAVRNLFSTTPEQFGIDGLALELASKDSIDVAQALKLSRHLGVAYYLVRSGEQVARLKGSTDVSPLVEIGQWHLFTTKIQPAPSGEVVNSTPVVAWLPARFRNRSPNDFDTFNLGELLIFEARADVCVLWALSSNTNAWDAISKLPRAIVVVDPAAVFSNTDQWLTNLITTGAKLDVLLLNDNSNLAVRVHEHRSAFARYTRLNTSEYSSQRHLTTAVAGRIIEWQNELPASIQHNDWKLWRMSTAYFPAWETTQGDAVWLTGEGGMAVLALERPSLRWHRSPWRIVGGLTSLFGIVLAVFCTLRLPISSFWVQHKNVRVSTKAVD